MKCLKKMFLWGCVFCFLRILSPVTCPYAEVVLDGTLGISGSLNGPNYSITSDLGTQVGQNLFHSFSLFNLDSNESAVFKGPDTVSNIISRITGGQSSYIDGSLTSEIANANLYLMNPSGIIFGPNAQLDITGSFHISTADYLTLGQNGMFHANSSGNSILTSSPVEAFGFLTPLPSAVNIDGSLLSVLPGKNISIIGGPITIENNAILHAKGGRIDTVSVSSSGKVIPETNGVDTNSFKKMGNVDILNDSYLYTSDDNGGQIYICAGNLMVQDSNIWAETQGSGPGGSIDIIVDDSIVLDSDSAISTSTVADGVAGNVSIITGSLDLKDKSSILAISLDQGTAGNISVDADNYILINGPGNGSFSGMLSYSLSGDGPAGDISIKTSDLTLKENALISASSSGSGDSGTIIVDAKNLDISSGSQILTNTKEGIGGNIEISLADSLKISGDSNGFTSGLFTTSKGGGDGGDVIISTSLFLLDAGRIGVLALASGNAGSAFIDTDTLSVLNTGAIDVYTESSGNAGSIDIHANNSIWIDGTDGSGYYSRLAAYTNGSGKGGYLTLDSPNILVSNGATIYNRTFDTGTGGDIFITGDFLDVTGTGQISCSTFGSAPAGNIVINTKNSVNISGSIGTDPSGIFAASYGSGAGGQILVNTEDIKISDGGVFQVTSTDTGEGGAIILKADTIKIKSGGTISSGAEGSGKGGNIVVTADSSLDISGQNPYFYSGLFANTNAAGNSGNVTISTGHLLISENGAVEAGNIAGSGNGGDISVNADTMILSNQGGISTATADTGKAGNVQIDGAKVSLFDGAYISSSSSGTGDAGTISINTPDQLFLENSKITTEANFSDGGNIFIQINNIFRMVDSDITATVGGGLGNGGNISIDPIFVILDNSRVIANAYQGNGGNIHIVADYFFSDTSSIVNASSQLGIDGTINIETPNIDLNSSFAVLPEYNKIPVLGSDQCQVRTNDTVSSLIKSGRGGLVPGFFIPLSAPVMGLEDL